MNGSDLGAIVGQQIILLLLIAFVLGIAVCIGGWALWHFVISHMHWSWS